MKWLKDKFDNFLYHLVTTKAERAEWESGSANERKEWQ